METKIDITNKCSLCNHNEGYYNCVKSVKEDLDFGWPEGQKIILFNRIFYKSEKLRVGLLGGSLDHVAAEIKLGPGALRRKGKKAPEVKSTL